MPMPPPIDAPGVRRVLLTELARATMPRADSGGSYELDLLGPSIQGNPAWWRDFSFRFEPDFKADAALAALDCALSWHTTQDPFLATLDRQLMARACLRLGAWRMLGSLLGTQLRELRASCPTPYRMSRATGLTAEWALAADQPALAIFYANESLAWGAEPHRIRSYLAYATHARQCGVAPLDEIHFLLSTEATRLQASLKDRHVFSLLHTLRLRIIRHLLPKGTAHADGWNTLKRDLIFLLEAAPADSSPQHQGILSAALLPGACAPICSAEQVQSAVRALFRMGRWRDLILLHQSGPERFARLAANAVDFVAQLDARAELQTS
jgi:hypothetical protein